MDIPDGGGMFIFLHNRLRGAGFALGMFLFSSFPQNLERGKKGETVKRELS